MVFRFWLSRHSDRDHYFDNGVKRKCCFWSRVGIAIYMGRYLYDWHDCICEEKFKGRAEVMERQNKLRDFVMIAYVWNKFIESVAKFNFLPNLTAPGIGSSARAMNLDIENTIKTMKFSIT